MKRKAPFISRKHPLGDWGAARYEDNFFFDEDVNEWKDDTHKSICLIGELLGEVLGWLSEGNPNAKGFKDCMFRKSIALVWCIRPDLFKNKSLRELSRMGGVGVTPASLSKHVAYFTERFGRFHNGTKTEEAKKSYSASAKRVHNQKKLKRGESGEYRREK